MPMPERATMRGILTGFIILVTFCGTTSACSCFPMSDVKRYCDADFVMKIKVKGNLKIPGGENAQSIDAYYPIKIKGDPLKFLNENAVQIWNRLYTGSNSALCGVTLQKGKKYLIAGNVNTNSGIMRINSCTSLVTSSNVRKTYRWWRKNEPDCDVTMTTSTHPY